MARACKTWLETLFWEVKSRFFYVLFSLILCLFVSYKSSIPLLYLFVLSCDIKENVFEKVESSFFSLQNIKEFFINIENKNHYDPCFVSDFSLTLTKMGQQELFEFSRFLDSASEYSIKFIFTNVEEAFSSTVLICFVFSLVAIFPYFIYAFLSFLAPTLFLHDRKKLIFYFIKFFSLWFVFITILQNKVIPIFSEFLLKFNIDNLGFHVLAETKIYSYCVWAISFFLIANFIFLLFYLVVYLILNNKIKIQLLLTQRKTCRLIILLIASLLAPPDLVTQLLLAFILMIFFEISIYLFFVYKNLIIYKNCNSKIN